MAGSDLRVVTETGPGGVVVIRVHGGLDGWSGCSELSDVLVVAAGNSAGRTVVDLSGVGFADSAGLHALLRGLRAHGETGALLMLAGPLSAGVHRLFEVTGTLGAFRFVKDVEAAFTP
ncbi:STAS domain-containing protein [Streptomyces nitrosporeus]|uniref:STAS domain-containing protein n=1 Tax=Streptomyces nitrosporeus TaxID=28894 RepID=UPI00331D5EE8